VSSARRKAELRAEQEQADREREEEEWRVANLSWYERIEEIDDIYAVKAVLHEIVDRLDQALASRGGFPRTEEPL